MLTRLLEQKVGPDFISGRCIQMRFAENGCTLCEAVCPFSAVSAGDTVEIERKKCRDCGLCAAACPGSALHNSRLSIRAVLGKLRNIHQPVLGCSIKNNSIAHVKIPCLGWLGAEELLVLELGVTQNLQINCTQCHSCENFPAIRQMLITYAELKQSLPGVWQNVRIVEEQNELNFQPVMHSRREFFRNFRSVLVQEVRERVDNAEMAEEVPYGEKSLPETRSVLNLLLDKQAGGAARAKQLFPRRALTEACDGCGDCEAICPTQALNAEEPDSPPRFNANHCLECGLCEAFCPEDAIHIEHASLYHAKKVSWTFVESKPVGAEEP